MLMPDVNVLIYAHREESPDHEAYAKWLSDHVEGDEPLACSELVLSAFLRIVTHRRVFEDPTPLEVALEFTGELVRSPGVRRVRPGAQHFEIFTELTRATNARGKLIADAYHAALAIEYGCEFITTDGDFARFPRLRYRHPLRLASL
jgi:toxin-antitoxin system PIN domain toxin